MNEFRSLGSPITISGSPQRVARAGFPVGQLPAIWIFGSCQTVVSLARLPKRWVSRPRGSVTTAQPDSALSPHLPKSRVTKLRTHLAAEAIFAVEDHTRLRTTELRSA